MNTLRYLLIFISFIIIYSQQSYGAVVLTAETNRPATSTYAQNEDVQITFTITGFTAGQKTNYLVITILDENGAAYSGFPTSIPFTASSTGGFSYVYTAPSSRLGYYEVHAQTTYNGQLAATLFPSGYGTRPAGFITYAVVPNPASHADYGDGNSRFGMQGGFSTSVNVIPYLGVRYVIAGNTSWSAFEPTIGNLVTSNPVTPKTPTTASAISGLKDFAGNSWNTYFIATPTTGNIPAWASAQTMSGVGTGPLTTTGSTNGTTEFPKFAKSLAGYFSSNFSNQTKHYYQMTWEPDLGANNDIAETWKGTAAEITSMYELGYKAIWSVDPRPMVAGPTFSSFNSTNATLLNTWIAAGMAKYIDAFSFHAYVSGYPAETHGIPSLLRSEWAAVNAAAGKQLPFFSSEHGFMSSPPAATWQAAGWTSATQFGGTPLLKAQGDIRTTLMILGEHGHFDISYYIADYPNTTWTTAAVPLSQVNAYGFYYNLDYTIPYGTDKVGPKSIVPAYAAMTYLLDGSSSNGPLTLSGTQVGYSFTSYTGSTKTYVVWDYSTTSSYTTPSGTTSVCTWMGVCTATAAGTKISVTASPTYIK